MEISKQVHFEFRCDQPSSVFTKQDGCEFCIACKTAVLDLHDKTHDEIHSIIEQHGGNVCASIFPDQLNEHRSTGSRINLKVAATGLIAVLMAMPERSAAQQKDSVKVEQHDTITIRNTREVVAPASDTASAVLIESKEKISKPYRPEKRLELFHIGRRHFYLTWRFPFFKSRILMYGRYRTF